MLRLGIDDSGRGPVIGPMVLAGVLVSAEVEKKWKKAGVKDSKQLSKSRRQRLAEKIKAEAVAYEIVIVEPREIDTRWRAGTNLNKLEAIKTAKIINALSKGFGPIEVIVDCPSNNIKSWQNYMMKYVDKNQDISILCEHKADVKHVVCSAASILAKVTRDAEIEKIKKLIGVDFGSGYSSDPITRKFIENHAHKHKKHGIVRETWRTWQEQETKRRQKKLTDF